MRLPVISLALLACLQPALAAPTTYSFTINRAASGVTGSFSSSANTSGTLIGNWDAATNSTGTRTKPGLFGTFGSTENVAVGVQINGTITNNSLSTDTTGTFQFSIDPATNTCAVAGYSANLLNGATLTIPVNATIQTASFRTRTPDSTYPGGIPVTLPVGDATVTALAMVQDPGTATGTLTPSGANTWTFAVAPVVTMTASFTLLGNAIDAPSTPAPIAMTGTITVSGNTASISSSFPVTITQTQQPNTILPQAPADIPTVLPTGSTAHVLLDLTLTQTTVNVQVSTHSQAAGTRVRCAADLDDGSGTGTPDDAVTIDDLLYFLGRYEAGSVAADLDDGSGTGVHDGAVTIDDLLYFLGHYEGGC